MIECERYLSAGGEGKISFLYLILRVMGKAVVKANFIEGML